MFVLRVAFGTYVLLDGQLYKHSDEARLPSTPDKHVYRAW